MDINLQENAKITIDIDGKTTSKIVEFKELNIYEEAEVDDLFLEYIGNNSENLNSGKQIYPKKLYTTALKVIKLCTNYTDEEIKEIPKQARIEIFNIVMENMYSKKK